MVEIGRPISEGDALDSFLDELEREHEVKEIAGWRTGFVNLDRALDGVSSGLYFLVGPPACGKTAFAKQLLDQVAMHNDALGIFAAFAESQTELRIKTLARLSAMDSKEIRRGSAYLLHWYGAPRLTGSEIEQLSPSWEKVRRAAEQARRWLESVYLLECGPNTTVDTLAAQFRDLRGRASEKRAIVVIDDCQRLSARDRPIQDRVAVLAERLHSLAKSLNAALWAIWPDLGESTARIWAEKALGADVVMVMEPNTQPTKKVTEPDRAMNIHIVKNRGGERGSLCFEFQPAFSRFVEANGW